MPILQSSTTSSAASTRSLIEELRSLDKQRRLNVTVGPPFVHEQLQLDTDVRSDQNSDSAHSLDLLDEDLNMEDINLPAGSTDFLQSLSPLGATFMLGLMEALFGPKAPGRITSGLAPQLTETPFEYTGSLHKSAALQNVVGSLLSSSITSRDPLLPFSLTSNDVAPLHVPGALFYADPNPLPLLAAPRNLPQPFQLQNI